MLSENRLNRIVSRVLNEAGFGGYRKNRYSSPSGGTQKTTSDVWIKSSKATMVKDPNTGEDKEKIVVTLGINTGFSTKTLADAINKELPPTVMKARPLGTSSMVALDIDVDRRDEVYQVVHQLEHAIKQLGTFNDDSVDKMCERIGDAVYDTFTQSDKDASEEMSLKNWGDLVTKLHDPEVRKSLLAYQMSDNYARQYGNVLSPNNVWQILSQFPTAAFVTTRGGWAKYGRKVNRGAQKIRVTMPTSYGNSKNDKSKLDAAAQRLGWRSYDDAKTNSKNAEQVMHNIRMQADDKKSGFVDVPMYDVSQTTPIDPNNDKWSIEMGLSNNVSGVLNTIASAHNSSIAAGSEDAKKLEQNKKIIDDLIAKAMPNRRAFMEKLCQRNRFGVQVDTRPFSNVSDADFIVRATYEFAKSLGILYGYVKQGDIERLATLCAAAVCISTGISNSMLTTQKVVIPRDITNEDIRNSFTICKTIIPAMAKVTVPKKGTLQMLTQNEHINRSIMMISESEKQFYTPAEFVQLVKNVFGVMPPEQNNVTDEVEESRRIIKRIVNEEVRRILANKKWRK